MKPSKWQKRPLNCMLSNFLLEDVQRVIVPILRHRIIRNYSAEAEYIGIEAIVEQLK